MDAGWTPPTASPRLAHTVGASTVTPRRVAVSVSSATRWMEHRSLAGGTAPEVQDGEDGEDGEEEEDEDEDEEEDEDEDEEEEEDDEK